MPTYNSSQRAAITQFVNFTQAKESIAARLLKSHDWDVERAVNARRATPLAVLVPATSTSRRIAPAEFWTQAGPPFVLAVDIPAGLSLWLNTSLIAPMLSLSAICTNTLFFQLVSALTLCMIISVAILKHLFPMPKRKATSSAHATTTKAMRHKRVKVQQHYSGSSNSGPSPVQQNLKKLFDSYREDAVAEPEKFGTDGTMQYLQDLHVELDDAIVMAIFDLLDAPAMGEMNKEGFVDGWQRVSSPSNPCDSAERQEQYIKVLRQKLQSDPAFFKQVYKSSFKYAKPEGQRAVPVDMAFTFWDMFFRDGHGGIEWNTSSTKWMDMWAEFYTSKNNRPVNKDLWNQVAELVTKTKEPGGETLGWWSEDGAWPTAVDDYVAFVREKRQAGMDTT